MHTSQFWNESYKSTHQKVIFDKIEAFLMGFGWRTFFSSLRFILRFLEEFLFFKSNYCGIHETRTHNDCWHIKFEYIICNWNKNWRISCFINLAHKEELNPEIRNDNRNIGQRSAITCCHSAELEWILQFCAKLW